MSRTRRFVYGVGANYLSQAVITVCGLWLTWFLLRCVGQDEYGLWLVALQLLTFLELMDLGVIALIPREVAYVTGRASGPEARTVALAELLGKMGRLILWQTPLVALAAAVFWWVGGGQDDRLAVPLGAVAVMYVVLFPFRIFQPALQGLQDLAYLGYVNTAGWLVQAAMTVVLVLAGCGFWSLVGGWVAGRVIVSLLCWQRLYRAFPGTLPRRLHSLPFREGKRILGSGLWVSLGRVAQVLLNGTEIIILGKLLGPAAVVVYVCTGKLTAVFTNQAYTLVTTAEPALSELKVSELVDRIVRVATALSQLMLLLSGAITCVVLATNGAFVQWWVGADRYGGLTLTALLVAAMLIRHLTFTVAHILYCFGYEKVLAIIGISDGLLTVAGTIVFTYLLGLIGAPLGSLVGVCLISLPVCLYFLGRDTDVSAWGLLRSHLPWFWRFAGLAGACAALPFVWQPQGVLGLIAVGSGVCVLYGLFMWPMVRRSPLGAVLLPHLAAWRGKLFGPFFTEPAPASAAAE